MDWDICEFSNRPRLSFSFPRHLASKLAMRENEKASAISCAGFVLHGDHQVELAGMSSMSRFALGSPHACGSSALSLAPCGVDQHSNANPPASRPVPFSRAKTLKQA